MLTTRYILDEAHLKYYDERLKSWVLANATQKTIPSSLYPWTLSEKAGAVGFWPVGGTKLKPTVDFLFSETGPAEGTKSPDNPSTITGVSSVKVARCGKNLSGIRNSASSYSVDFTNNNNGSYTVNGTATGGNAALYLITVTSERTPCCSGQKFIASGCPSGGSSSTYSAYISLYDKSGHFVVGKYDTGTSVELNITENGFLSYCILVKDGTAVNNLVFWPQVELASTSSAFEKPDRTDYTISLGNTYYGGEIDLATGLMTVTHKVYDIGESITNYSTSNAVFYFDSPIANTAISPTCESFVFNQVPLSSLANGEFRYQLDSSIPQGSIRWLFKATDYSDVESFSAAFAGKKLVYKLATPYTVQLSPTSISALAQTDKYTPRLNTIYTGASSVQVGYAKSPIREEYEITQAIVAQGGEI